MKPIGMSTFVSICALTTISYGQSVQPAQNAAQTTPKAQTAVPVTMTECEGINNCATWTFLGAQGNGQWPSGEIANLNVERYDDNSVTIRRADSTGPSAGLTAVYTGTRHGDRVGGDFASSWPGHWDNKSGNWYATVAKDQSQQRQPLTVPLTFHVCSGEHCFTFYKEGNVYVNRTNLPYQENEVRTVEMRSFTRDSVSLYEYDRGSYPLTAEWTGSISPDGGEMVDGTVRITSWKGHPTNNPKSTAFRMAWGGSIEKIPGK